MVMLVMMPIMIILQVITAVGHLGVMMLVAITGSRCGIFRLSAFDASWVPTRRGGLLMTVLTASSGLVGWIVSVQDR